MWYSDVHTHLTDTRFQEDLSEVVNRAEAAQLKAIVVNGLEPQSNRQILEMAKQYNSVVAALGIYPIHSLCEHPELLTQLPYEVERFNIEDELKFIESQAKAQSIGAIGECGLDGYWVGKESFAQQEKVFVRLVELAKTYELPIIIHSRKLELRCFEIIEHHDLGSRVDFHCYCGKAKLASQYAEKYGWKFSIPANIERDHGFQKLARILPLECILTETDAPYLPPEKGQRNEPANVVGTVAKIAELRGMELEAVKAQLWKNFCGLLGEKYCT